MNTHPTTELLPLVHVAAELGVSLTTVQQWVKDRDLDAFRKGSNVGISREALTRFVLLNTVRAKRPDWLTAEVESEFRRQQREMIRQEIQNERMAA